MSLTHAQALASATRYLAENIRSDVPLRIYAEHGEEFDVGWVFFYQSARYMDSGEAGEMLVGCAPLLVDGESGRVFVLGTALSHYDYIEAYRACGDPLGQPLPEVALTGALPNVALVDAIRSIHVFTSLGLTESKRMVDDALKHKANILRTPDVSGARALASSLTTLRFIAHLRYKPGITKAP